MYKYRILLLTLTAALTMATSSHVPALHRDRINESVRLLEQSVDSDHYSAEVMTEYRTTSQQTMERLRALTITDECDETQPLPPIVAARLRQALLQIENTAFYTGVWNWDRVRATALRFGTSIPVVYMDETTEIRSAWDNGHQRLIIFGELTDETDPSFVSTIIHEATHAVVTEDMIAYTGFTPNELFLLRLNCEEFSRELSATTEVLAYVNSGMWKRLHNTPVHPFELWASEAFHTIPATDWEAVEHASDAMMDYIYSARETHLGVVDLPNCGPIVAERGPHRGQIVRPAMIAPDYMGPIFLHLIESR